MVYYFGFYISDKDKEKYKGNTPGNLKMHYVVEQLKESGFNPAIVSLASRRSDSLGFYPKERSESQGCNLSYLGSISGKGYFWARLNMIYKKLQFVWMMMSVVKRKDTVILYHSTEYTKLMAQLKRFITRKVIIEVEEIYGYSAVADKPWVNEEIANIKKMDLHICVNEGIPQDLGLKEGNFVVSYGVGIIPKRRINRFDDGKTHVVYAGTIEMKKRGALTAIDAGQLLPENYVLHILGFGSNENIKLLQEKIEEINNDLGRIQIEYNGFKSGQDLDDFLFKCHIGLSSNVMRPNFANNSFPSKVITYMCHDLSVVLGYAKAFFDVPMSKGWVFYHEYTPEKIAEAITMAKVVPVGYYHSSITDMNNNLQEFFKTNCQ